MCGSRKPSNAPPRTCAAGPRRSDMTETLARKATAGRVNRRQFLVGSMATGAGLTCGFSLLPTLIGGAGEALAAGNFSPTVWYTIDRGGIITVHITKSEMGQHVGTALAQAVAEELEADWKDIRIDYPDPAERWGLMVTGGSWSVNNNFDTLSRCGAAGRMALIEGGAKAMGVPEGECRAASSRVVHKSGKSISYADLVSSGKVDKTFSPDDLKKIQLKKAADYKIVGKPVPALDIPAKTNGTARYGMDMFVPGMAYAKIARPSVRYGAKATNVDDSEAKNIPGYQQFVSVADPTGTATHYVMAIADSYPAAMAAANALKIEWDLGPNAGVSSDGILEHAKQLTADPAKGLSFWDIGDAGKALAGAATKLEAEYVTPLAIHAPLEPMNCVAFERDGTWHIYSGSQFQTRSGPLVAAAVGAKPEQVLIHQVYLGGGFGRRLEADAMVPAALAAKAVGHRSLPLRQHGQEGQARFLLGQRRRQLVHHPEPPCARDRERSGAGGDAVRAVPLGGAGLDLLGGGELRRRARAQGQQGSGGVPPGHAGCHRPQRRHGAQLGRRRQAHRRGDQGRSR